jgi:hypothetical protein
MIWLLAGYPVWWALGLGVLIFPILAVPMGLTLLRRRANLRVPAELVLWLLFLLTTVVGVVALGVDPTGTVPGSVAGRLPGVGFRLVEYVSLTVLLLYTVNLTGRELPQRRLVALLGWLFVITVAGGLLGTVAGGFQFSSPVELLLPAHVRANSFVQSLVHPSAAQVMQVLGYDSARPAAPWGYTNTWGNNFALLLGWFLVAAVAWRGRTRSGTRMRRLACAAVLVVGIVPVIVSLNRGLWIDLALAGGYVALRLARLGRLWVLGTAAAAVALVGILVVATPLSTVVQGRLQNGKSDNVRMFVTERALDGMWISPVIGLGSTRNTQGSDQSIAVGDTADCDRCGGHTIGGNGQLWQLLYAQGLVGTACYIGFFLVVLWRRRADSSGIGMAGSTAIVVSLASMFYYNSLVTPLAFTFLSCALLWRNDKREAVA